MTIAKNQSISEPLLIDVRNTTLDSAEQLERLQSDNPALHLDVEIEIDRDPKLNRSLIPKTHTLRQFQKTHF